jgi:hypothetical protein
LKAIADELKASQQASSEKENAEDPSAPDSDKITSSVNTGVVPVTGMAGERASAEVPLISIPSQRLLDEPPEEGRPPQVEELPAPDPVLSEMVERRQLKSIQEAIERLPPKAQRDALERLEAPPPHLRLIDQPKVIFATGGITNGKQALEVLNAGANVAMVYTALVYGGIGTISRIKDEMRAEIKKQAQEKRSAIGK